MALTPFVNSNMVIGLISRNMKQTSDTDEMYQNNDSRNNYYEAQKRADMYMKIKERKPMVFEYLQTGKPEKWVSITMYINPDKMSIAQQKVKGKQFTRGGIFYHHWGDDHPVMSLSGTTGYAGMKGIEALEKIYSASGTLLRYQNFGPSTYSTDSLTTQGDKVLLSDVDISSAVSVLNAAANSNSTSYISKLKEIVSKSSNNEREWKEYVENQRLIENATAGNKTMVLLNQQNEALRKKYYFPDGTGKDNSDNNREMVKTYTARWDEYLNIRKNADSVGALIQQTTDARKKAELQRQFDELHEEAKSMRKQWKFDLNFEYGSYTYQELVELKKEWIEAANKYVENKKMWQEYLSNAVDPSTGKKANLSDLQARNETLRQKNGFPYGNSDELARYVTHTKINNEDASLRINDLRSLTNTLLGSYQSVLKAEGILGETSKVKDKLATWSKSRRPAPSAQEYQNFAISEYRKIAGLDNSIITALAYQDTIYYSTDANTIFDLTDSFINSVDVSDFTISTPGNSPIPYSEDVVGKLSAITEDRARALNEVMMEMASYEEKEKQFFQELRSNALDDIYGDITNEWMPRKIMIYYENRVYVGHFDQFSYSRDAANPLLIRYEMRITIEKQVIGTSEG